ncbi:YedE family putative selenium transporter [Moorella naiadis]|uniref:YedE family putative selenium transporter n=1 Tax=Moorella naiadis (nom. illeg.) TaxID=3093670 RepID=UPI003D9CBA14
MSRILSPKNFMLLAGFVFGAIAAFMTRLGNPANMGICIACFYRDIAGALGLHRAAIVQYLRPEIMGIAFGAFLSALFYGEFRARGGSAPLVRFFLGVFFMIGALVFLGCPVRAVLRLAGGDLNAIAGLAGVIAGALLGIYFLKNGFNLGRWQSTYPAAGWLMPLFMLGLLLLAIGRPAFIFFSKEGPGASHALLGVSLAAGLIIGFLAQRTRMCFVGGWRDLFLVKDTYLFSGIAAFFVGALIVNAILGNIKIGFMGQPVAHTNQLWSFLGMTLAGLTATLLGGCPLRQTVLAGEGDTDAGVTIIGMLVGAALAHNFQLASSPQGPGPFGPAAVIIGLIFAAGVGFLMRESLD